MTSKRKLWVVETAGGLFHSLTFAAAVSVETLLGKKGPAVEYSLYSSKFLSACSSIRYHSIATLASVYTCNTGFC